MSISGFTFIRNGNKLAYPYLESIASMLPICDEVIVVVGNSDDGTRASILNLHASKIKIIDTVWDDTLRTGGKILAQQTDIGLQAISGDWGFYLQGDEVVHEEDLPKIQAAAQRYAKDASTDGLLFHYKHFYGNYDYISKPKTRGTYPYEVRLIKNNPLIRSFRDAQGFRKYSSLSAIGKEDPSKLQVRKIDAAIYHYGKVRGPLQEQERLKDFHKLWHNDDWVEQHIGDREVFEYLPDYPLIPFTGSHPAAMKDRINRLNWNFQYNYKMANIPLRYRILNFWERLTGLRPFDFRNYRLIQ